MQKSCYCFLRLTIPGAKLDTQMRSISVGVTEDGQRVRGPLPTSPGCCSVSTKIAHVREGRDIRLDLGDVIP